MKVIKPFLIILLIFNCFSLFSQEWIDTYVAKIDSNNLKEYVYYLASDSLKGRDSGDNGQKLAAEYIKALYQQNGLTDPVKIDSSEFFQKFNMSKYDAGIAWLKNSNEKKMYHSLKHFIYYGSSSIHDKKLENMTIDFIGNADKIEMENYQFRDSAVLFFSENLDSVFQKLIWLNDTYRINRFFIIGNEKKSEFKKFESGRIEIMSLCPDYLFERKINNNRYYNWVKKVKECKFNADVQVCILTDKIAERILGVKVMALKRAIKHKKIHSFKPFEVGTWRANVDSFSTIKTENVIGALEGTSLKNEYIIVTAHYDHVGVNYKNEICNGADDNASGTAALMELASVFSQAYKNGIKPERSIVFLAVTAEEKGLYGSRYYVEHPLFPLESTVLDLNMDMIGRGMKNKVYNIRGNGLKKAQKHLYKKSAKTLDDFRVDLNPNFFVKFLWHFSSDQFSFSRVGIPYSAFFTGLHKDYHTPRDDADKIRYTNMEKVTKMIFRSIWGLAYNPEKYPLKKIDLKEIKKSITGF